MSKMLVVHLEGLQLLLSMEVEYQNTTEQLFHPRFLEMLNGTAVLRFASWQMIDP